MSLVEVVTSTALGLVISLLTQLVVFPLYGFHPRLIENVSITAIFTAASIVRSFVVRRTFEMIRSIQEAA